MSNAHYPVEIGKAKTPAEDLYAATRRLGWMDARDGLGYSKDYDSWGRSHQLSYERGRHQYVIAKSLLGRRPRRWKMNERLTDLLKQTVPNGLSVLSQTSPRFAPYVDRKAA